MRPAILIAGLFGAAGVGLSAAAAHRGGGNLGTAAQMLLFHAPALLALGLAARGRLLAIAAAVLAVSVVLFAGDLVLRDTIGNRLFPMAAPLGGMGMIAGWLLVAAGAFAHKP